MAMVTGGDFGGGCWLCSPSANSSFVGGWGTALPAILAALTSSADTVPARAIDRRESGRQPLPAGLRRQLKRRELLIRHTERRLHLRVF